MDPLIPVHQSLAYVVTFTVIVFSIGRWLAKLLHNTSVLPKGPWGLPILGM
jgi:hypothetical protein